MSAHATTVADTQGTQTGPVGTTWTRAAALLGIVFVATLVPSVVLGNAPGTNASAAKIAQYYTTHNHQVGAEGLLSMIAVATGIGFFLYLRTYFEQVTTTRWLPSLFFAGALIFGISGVISAGVDFTLADHPKLQTASSLQVLNTIYQNLNWAALAVGLTLMYAALALIISRTHVLPTWVALVSWLMSLLAVSFFLSFVPLIATALWVLVVSIKMARRNPAVG